MKEIRWTTYNFIFHPFGDLLWHLFFGIITGGFLVYAIITTDYWLLIVSLLGVFFFFHPAFYKPYLMRIKINSEGIFINDKKYPWNEFVGFEIFSNDVRTYVYLVPKKSFSFGFDLPIEPFFVSVDEVREVLNFYLDEYVNSIPFFYKIYRSFFH